MILTYVAVDAICNVVTVISLHPVFSSQWLYPFFALKTTTTVCSHSSMNRVSYSAHCRAQPRGEVANKKPTTIVLSHSYRLRSQGGRQVNSRRARLHEDTCLHGSVSDILDRVLHITWQCMRCPCLAIPCVRLWPRKIFGMNRAMTSCWVIVTWLLYLSLAADLHPDLHPKLYQPLEGGVVGCFTLADRSAYLESVTKPT